MASGSFLNLEDRQKVKVRGRMILALRIEGRLQAKRCRWPLEGGQGNGGSLASGRNTAVPTPGSECRSAELEGRTLYVCGVCSSRHWTDQS